jgi:hypothetical protein
LSLPAVCLNRSSLIHVLPASLPATICTGCVGKTSGLGPVREQVNRICSDIVCWRDSLENLDAIASWRD